MASWRQRIANVGALCFALTIGRPRSLSQEARPMDDGANDTMTST
jgi:hypothetical protein